MPNESQNPNTSEYSADLLPRHVELLKKSAISTEVAEARGYRSLKSRDDLQERDFLSRQGSVPALAIPVHDVNGRVPFVLIRPNQPRSKGGRIIKYEQPKNTTLRLDVPPLAHAALPDTSKSLWIADGPREADSLVSTRSDLCRRLGLSGMATFSENELGPTCASRLGKGPP